MKLALVFAVGCGVPMAEDSPEEPAPVPETSSPAPPGEPGTQIGDEGTESCPERDLDPSDLFESGEPIADALALIAPGGEVAPVWFDGRATPLWTEIVVNEDTLRVRIDCAVVVEVHATLASDDGAVTLDLVDQVGLHPEQVQLTNTIPDAEWTGNLDPTLLHAAPCEHGGHFGLGLDFRAGGFGGTLNHECSVSENQRGTGTTTDPWTDTGGGDDTGTTTDTTTGPMEDRSDPVTVLRW